VRREGRVMSGLAATSKNTLTRFGGYMAAHWPLRSALGRSLSHFTDAELDRALAAAGNSRADLFGQAAGYAAHRQRLAKLMAHFGVAPDFAVRYFWDALRSADEICTLCGNRRRCQSWLDWPVSNDAPRVFCPNAETLDAIAFRQKTP